MIAEDGDTIPAIVYTERDKERLRPFMHRFMVNVQREKVNQATDELLGFMTEWAKLLAGEK
jgi:hypothetical protein